MAVPTHSIHTIHGTFSGIPSYSRHASQSLYSSHAGVVIERSTSDRYPPGLAKPAWRAAPVSLPSPGPGSGRRPPFLRNSRRPPPPPPFRAPPAQSIAFPSEDPFNDMNALVPSTSSMDVIPYPRTHLASLSHSYTVRLPQHHPINVLVRQRAAQDRETRSKVVAGILLNRVHAVGKPMRRMPPSPESPKQYKRSGLSRMISAEDL